MRKLILTAAIMTAMAAGPAHAAWSTIATGIYTTTDFQGTGYWGTFTWNGGTNSVSAYLGTFTLGLPSGSGLGWLATPNWYCADLHQTVASSTRNYYWTDDDVFPAIGGFEGTPEGNRRAAWMLNNFSFAPTVDRAALQMAVWEAIYDNGSSFQAGVGQGNFYVTYLSGSTGQNSAMMTAASNYYAASSDDGVGVYAWDQQNLMRGVPEPGTVVLLGLGLVASGIAVLRRRRS